MAWAFASSAIKALRTRRLPSARGSLTRTTWKLRCWKDSKTARDLAEIRSSPFVWHRDQIARLESRVQFSFSFSPARSTARKVYPPSPELFPSRHGQSQVADRR